MRPARRGEPLVLLHGTLCDARVFAPLLARLPGVEAIVPALDGAETTPAAAERLLSALPDRFALAGFSLGGIVALELVARAPHRVTRLALFGTTARPDPPGRHALRRAAVARAAAQGLERFVLEELWPSYVADAGRADPATRALIGTMAANLGLDAFHRHSEMAIHRADSRPRLAAVVVPTLVLCGAEDRACPPALHQEIAASIPGARLVMVAGAGHFAILEQPDAVADAVAARLDAPPHPMALHT